MTVQADIPKIAAVLSALALLCGCQADKTSVQLRNMSGSPAVMVLKQSRLRLANGQVFELTPQAQGGSASTAAGEAIIRLVPMGGSEQCFALHLADVPEDYYAGGSPRRLAVELGQDGALAAFPKPGKTPRVGVTLPSIACPG